MNCQELISLAPSHLTQAEYAELRRMMNKVVLSKRLADITAESACFHPDYIPERLKEGYNRVKAQLTALG